MSQQFYPPQHLAAIKNKMHKAFVQTCILAKGEENEDGKTQNCRKRRVEDDGKTTLEKGERQ